MRIGVDIDDTITDSWECLIPTYSKMFNIDEKVLHNSMPYYSSVKDLISLDEYYKVMLPVYDKIIPNVHLKDDVKDVIDKLYELGHTITFITSRGIDHTNAYKVSKDYLDKYNIKYERIITGCSDKAEACEKENIDLFIDDSIKHCQSVSKKGIDTLLFETYYNKDYKDIKHVASWNDIYDYIKGR